VKLGRSWASLASKSVLSWRPLLCLIAHQCDAQARENMRTFLKEKGLYVSQQANPMTLAICSRSGDVLEPMVKPQVKVDCCVATRFVCRGSCLFKLERICAVVCEMYRSTGGHCCGKRSKWADDIEVSAHRDNQRVALSLSLAE
jgi:valyl-tRNA synthetase